MSAVAAPASPFKGLAPFGESDLDALFFFGRARETEVIAANLQASRLTVLYGPSGVGKSSVLRAGVSHRLRAEAGVMVAIADAWAGDPLAAVLHALGEEEGRLADALEAAAARIGGDVYLILDQFEEYFLYHQDDDVLSAELAEVVARRGLAANVLIGIREDSLGRLDTFRKPISNLLANRLRLDRLDRAAAKEAIEGPIARYNQLVGADERVEVEPELVTRVLNEVAAGRVDLGLAGRGTSGDGDDPGRIEAPYLQLVLDRLWDVELRAGARRLRLQTLVELGGATRIVHDHLERAMAGLSPREQDAAAAMYNYLVTPSGTKIAHAVSDLAGYASVDEREAAAVLRRLSDERIIRAGENGGSGRYEIYHDVLADAVLAWRNRHAADQRLEQQQREAERRHRRMLQALAAALAALALVGAIAIYALVERSEARHQAAVAKAARARAQHQELLADVGRRDALEQKRNAQRSAAVAKKQRRKAEKEELKAQRSAREATRQKQRADAARLDALAQEARAEGNEAEARRLAREADNARAQAQAQEKVAKRQTRKAERSAALAAHRKKVGRAKQLEAEARSFLTEDPRISVERSLAALRAYSAAGLEPAVAAEDLLRSGLATLNIRAIVSNGGGAVHAAVFSPDASRVLLAGKNGARLFELGHGTRTRRLLPAVNLAAATFSPDGRLIAGAASDRTVHVWDAATGVPLLLLRHERAVRAVAFSPDGRFLASGSADGTARLWSVAGGLPLASFSHPTGARGGVHDVSFSPDGRRLLTVGGDRFARVFDVATRELVFPLNNAVLVNTARFSHDGRLIATAGADAFVRVWNARTGQPEFPPLRGGGQTTDLEFSPDDSLLATAGGVDSIARVWNLADRALTAIVTVHKSAVESVAFSPDGEGVVSSGREGNAYVWGSTGGFQRAALLGHQGPVTAASFSRDGTRIVTASDDGTARVWEPPRPIEARQLADHRAPVNAVAFSRDGTVVLSGGDDGTARMIRANGTIVTLQHGGPVTAASFGRDGRFAITASADRNARLWRVADGTLVSTLPHGARVDAARLSPDGRIAVTAGRDGEARLWAARSGALLHRLLHGHAVNDAQFSGDGRLVVTASADGTAAIWRVLDGRKLVTLAGHAGPVVAAAFSPNGRHVATASTDATAMIWNARSGVVEHALTGHSDDLTALTFSPDGSLLATSSIDRDARVWNVRSGKQTALLRVHIGVVSDVAFSADGRWVATAGPTAAAIWETRKRGTWPASPLYIVRGHSRPINDVAFSPRGWRIVTGSRDGSVRVYGCALCGGIRQLSAIARTRLHEIVRTKSPP